MRDFIKTTRLCSLIFVLCWMATWSTLAEAQPFAYVTNNSLSGNVSVIDTSTNTVVATVGVGNFPVGVAIAPNGAFVYVTNQGSNSVSVIDYIDQRGDGDRSGKK